MDTDELERTGDDCAVVGYYPFNAELLINTSRSEPFKN
jgi:hypothetical protein